MGHPRYQPAGYAFWIDIQVQNLAYNKDIKVLWSNDNWNTVNVAQAELEHDLGGGYEQWGVDVELPIGNYYYGTTSRNIEYAIVGTIDGVQYSDPGNNYYLGTYEDTIVKFLGGSVISADGATSYNGLVTVANLAYHKEVGVIYTTDEWNSSNYAPGYYIGGNHWGFDIPLEGNSPRSLEFAVEYKVQGTTYYDNNNGNNFSYQIGPQPQLSSPGTDYVEGREFFAAYDSNINAVSQWKVLVNGEEVDLSEASYLRFYLNSLDYTPADSLEMTFEVEDVHGFKGTFTKSFSTGRSILPEAVYGTETLSWPSQSKAFEGKIYTVDNQKPHLHVFDVETKEETLFDIAGTGKSIDLFQDGRIAILIDSTVYIYDQNGELVNSFLIQTSVLNIPVDLGVWENDEIWVASYVAKGAAKFDAQGQYQGFVSFPGFHSFRIFENTAYLVSNFPQFAGYELNQEGEIVSETVFSSQSNPEMEHMKDVAVFGDKIAILHNFKVALYDRDWNFLYKWSGRAPYGGENPAGAFGSVISTVSLWENQLYVGDFGSSRMHEFVLLD